MRRREFMTLLGGAAGMAARARAQQPAMPVIGLLDATSPDTYADLLRAFRVGPEGYRLCRGRERGDRVPLGGGSNDRLPALAADLVRRQVAVIVTLAGRRRPCGKGGNHDDPDRLHRR